MAVAIQRSKTVSSDVDTIEKMTAPIGTHSMVPASPVHPLASLATLLLDNVFGIVEIVDPFLVLLTSLAVGAICAATVTLVQRYLDHDDWGPAAAKGMVMGVIAGVPFQVTGTAVGGILLAWSGAHQWLKRPGAPDAASEKENRIIHVKPK